MEQASGLIMPTSFVHTKAPRSGRSRAGQFCSKILSSRIRSRPEAILTILLNRPLRRQSRPKLDEQPDPVVEPSPVMKTKTTTTRFYDDVNELELKAADASAQVAGHKFGTREYADAIADKLRPQEKTHHGESAAPSHDGTRKQINPIVVVRSNDAKQNGIDRRGSGLLSHQQGLDLEEYRRNKAKMHQMKAAGVIQE